jgi:hypothetical protein
MVKQNNNTMTNDLMSVDLNEPLLSQTVAHEDVEEQACHCHDFKRTDTKDESWDSSIPSMLSLKSLAIVSGIMMAACSQIALWIALWDDTILSKSTVEVVEFSLAWSFWTCLIVFSSMSFLVRFVRQRYLRQPSSALGQKLHNELLTNQDEDDIVFQVEAFYVVGALASISVVWLINDFFQTYVRTATTAIQIHPVGTVLFAGFGYAMFARWILSRRNRTKNLKQPSVNDEVQSTQNGTIEKLSCTYQMIAVTLGLIVGVCSQFVLAMTLWRDNMTKPIVDSVLMFSLLWSIVTVLLTLTGCLSLRILVVTSDENGQVSSVANHVLLLMETAYVSSSLIGVCTAWIVIDILSGMTSQILPSIFMLSVSLVAFRLILHIFPEEVTHDEDKEEVIKTLEVV